MCKVKEFADKINVVFVYRMVQRCPLVFLQSPVAGTALDCANASSIHDHREAFSSVMKFFKDLIHCPFDESLVRVDLLKLC